MKSNLNQFLHNANTAENIIKKPEPKPDDNPQPAREVVTVDGYQWVPEVILEPDGWPADCVEPGEPCLACGWSEKWWDIRGGEHCMRCGEGLRLLSRARRLAAQVRRIKFFSRRK